MLPMPPYPCPDEFLCPEEKTYHLISSLDVNKASGLDKISARMLKGTAPLITPMITALFNMSLSTGIFPNSWKSSLIVPIPKPGDSSNPGNYRPISLLPIVSKLLEKHVEYYRPTGRFGHYIFRTRKLRAEDSCYVL